MDYPETQKKLLLVSKIVDVKIRSLAQVEEENLNLKTVEELNIKLRELHCLLTWRLFITPMKYLNTTIGVNTDNIKKRTVNDVVTWYVEVLLLLT
jgi:hypothetical protein